MKQNVILEEVIMEQSELFPERVIVQKAGAHHGDMTGNIWHIFDHITPGSFETSFCNKLASEVKFPKRIGRGKPRVCGECIIRSSISEELAVEKIKTILKTAEDRWKS